jgi:hypothetical protein
MRRLLLIAALAAFLGSCVGCGNSEDEGKPKFDPERRIKKRVPSGTGEDAEKADK